VNTRSKFKYYVVADFEYEVSDGGLPRPLCLVAYLLDENFKLIRPIKLWRGEFGRKPPFPIDDDCLFVAYSAWAELTCFLVLGWPFPKHIFDLHTAFLSASNILLPYEPDEVRARPGKRLPDACRAYGIEGWEGIEKGSMARDIGEGRWRQYGQPAVFAYCEEDVSKSTQLFCAMLRRRNAPYPKPIDPQLIIKWSEYSAKCVALIQARGMPVDMRIWNAIQENRRKIIDALRRRFDPSYRDDEPIFDADGSMTYERLAKYLISRNITEWPRTASGRLQTDDDAFKLMSHLPGIEGLHALKDSMSVIARAKLPISGGRNRPSIFPFGTVSGRNAHSKSLFNAHAGMRGLIKFPRRSIGAYEDFRTQEPIIAAFNSDDERLIADYLSGDIYHKLAMLCNLTDEPDPKIWKANNKQTRQHMKRLQLAINYGMSVPSLARGLNNCHVLIAAEVITRHQQAYPKFWQWRDAMVKQAMIDRYIVEPYSGWTMYLSTSPNKRTLYNFPMQAGGAAMLRDATVRLCEAGIVPLMLVHDGILFEEETEDAIRHAAEIMRKSGALVCGGIEVGVDVEIIGGGERFADGRDVAKAMWETIMRALREIGAIK
jgi:hypothetical protein